MDVFLNIGKCYGLRLDGRCYANVADGIVTMVHNVLHVFYCLWVADGTSTVADVIPSCDKHEGRCYAWVIDGKIHHYKGC